MCNHLYVDTFIQSHVPSFLCLFIRSLVRSFVRSFGGSRRGGGGHGAAAPRTKYAELASGFPSPKKKSGFFSVLDVFKIPGFLEVFWTFLVVLFDDERPTGRRGEAGGVAGAPPVKFKYRRTGDYNLRGTIILENPLQD